MIFRTLTDAELDRWLHTNPASVGASDEAARRLGALAEDREGLEALLDEKEMEVGELASRVYELEQILG